MYEIKRFPYDGAIDADGHVLEPAWLWSGRADPELSLAYCRAYNRWIADFCRDSGGRLVPISHLTLLDPEGSRRARARRPRRLPRRLGRALHALAQGARTSRSRCAVEQGRRARRAEAIHPTYEPAWSIPVRFDRLGRSSAFLRCDLACSSQGWGGSGRPFLDRCDAVFETISGRAVPLQAKPSEVFTRPCFISGDPDETAAPLLFAHVGAHLFMWATDYPHPDHPATWVDGLTRQVDGLRAVTHDAYLGGSVRRIYKI